MNFKKNADANRNALFGGAADPSSKGKAKRPTASSAPPAVTATTATTTTTTTTTAPSTSLGYNHGGGGSPLASEVKNKRNAGSLLSEEAKVAKRKEAEDYKEKANKAMQRSFFNRPDPVAASTLYKRAADAYAAIGDARLERFYRSSSADCNMQCGAYASAAEDYTRTAELTLAAEDLTDLAQRRRDAANCHKKAAEAWTQMNEKAKAAACQVKAAAAMNDGQGGTLLSSEALAGMEEAVEAHVPDVMNPYGRYRQTGHSAFIDPESEETIHNPSRATIEMAKEHLVSRSYAHEPLQQLVNMLVGYGEYASALYAAGAATVILEQDGISTLSLGRAYVTETILTLALGDSIAAEQEFMKRHVQKTSYLSSRECKLAEELFRAIKTRDQDALDEARSPTGSNRAALANLDESLRTLVQQLRISGVARKQIKDTTGGDETSETKKATSASEVPPTSFQELMNLPTGYEKEAVEGEQMDGDALAAELDDLNFSGLEGSDEEEDGNNNEDDDDDFDLR